MNKIITILCMSISVLLLGHSVHAEPEEVMSIYYGRVTEAEQVDVKSHTGEGALIGGLLGAATYNMYSTGKLAGDLIMGTGIGAATGAGVEYLGEWRMKGTRYTIESTEDGVLHIITDQTGVRAGDCVAIEATSKHANLRRVSDVHCESPQKVGTDPHLDDHAKQSATACYEAKKALLGAETDADLEQAKRRVRALCD
jgi:hypothetical protein